MYQRWTVVEVLLLLAKGLGQEENKDSSRLPMRAAVAREAP